MSTELLPCPFCGGTSTAITPQGRVWNGRSYGAASSWIVRHHCEPVSGQPTRGIERIGRDEESARAAWNTRATQPQASQGAETRDKEICSTCRTPNLCAITADRCKFLLPAAPKTPEVRE